MSYLMPVIRALGAMLILAGTYTGIAALGLYYLEVQGNWVRWLIPLAQIIILIALYILLTKLLYSSKHNIYKSNHW